MNFPPLPTRSDTRPELHSRVSSLQGFQEHGDRISTPQIPPGFENAHVHSTPLTQDAPTDRPSPPKSITAPVLPAIPNLAQLSGTSKSKTASSKREEEPVDKTPILSNRGAVDTDEQDAKSPDDSNNDKSLLRSQVDEELSSKTETSVGGEEFAKEEELETAGRRPTNIDISPSDTTSIPHKEEVLVKPSSKVGTPILDSTVVNTPDTLPSQPGTPGTATPETSKNSAPRPRTLRLTTSMIQQAEAARLGSPTVERSTTLPTITQPRQTRSRQPSLSSMSPSRPSSPSVSERLMSQDVSRAGSPPPGGIIGTAPGRAKSKAQAKKERKEKAKKVDLDDSGTASNSVTPAAEEVGPIIARQKKQKKSKTSSGSTEGQSEVKHEVPLQTKVEKAKHDKSEAPSTNTDISNPQEEVPRLAESPQKPSSSTMRNTAGTSFTVHDLYTESSRTPNSPTAIQSLLSSHVSSMSKLLNEMVTSGHIAQDHPWLSNPSLSSAAYKLPPDSRRGQDYLNANGYSSSNAFGYLYVDQKEKKELRNGGFVKDSTSTGRPEDLLNSFLITPRGWVIRHLSPEESERLQELEYRRLLDSKQFNELGSMTGLSPLEQDDYINLGGGLSELIRRADRHGVQWVIEEDDIDQFQEYGNERDAMYESLESKEQLADYIDEEPDDDTDEDVALDYAGHGPSMPGGWDSGFSSLPGQLDLTGQTPPGLQSLPAERPSNANLRTMDTDALHKKIHEKQREMDATRKEMDKAEKLLSRKAKEFGKWRDTLLKA